MSDEHKGKRPKLGESGKKMTGDQLNTYQKGVIKDQQAAIDDLKGALKGFDQKLKDAEQRATEAENRSADRVRAQANPVQVRALANELATLCGGQEVSGNVCKELVMPSADQGGAKGCEPAPIPPRASSPGVTR